MTSLQGSTHKLQDTSADLAAKVNVTNQIIAFSAVGPEQYPEDDKVVKFDTTVYNTGGGYDPETSIFTCPLTGMNTFFFPETYFLLP